MFSSQHIQNEVLTIPSENPSSGDKPKSKLQAKLYPSKPNLEQPEE